MARSRPFLPDSLQGSGHKPAGHNHRVRPRQFGIFARQPGLGIGFVSSVWPQKGSRAISSVSKASHERT